VFLARYASIMAVSSSSSVVEPSSSSSASGRSDGAGGGEGRRVVRFVAFSRWGAEKLVVGAGGGLARMLGIGAGTGAGEGWGLVKILGI
jgi:hypothetical protein